MPKLWNRWWHCIGGTYGSWLPGDPRGYRTRRHRKHVDGDYRQPPPAGKDLKLHERVKAEMKYQTVKLTAPCRHLVCVTMAATLLDYDVELVEISVSSMHFHILCRYPLQLPQGPDAARDKPRNLLKDGRDPIPRHILGRAKRAASIALLKSGYKLEGKPQWSRRTKFEPIKNRQHQLAVVKYIRHHIEEDAAIWSQIRK